MSEKGSSENQASKPAESNNQKEVATKSSTSEISSSRQQTTQRADIGNVAARRREIASEKAVKAANTSAVASEAIQKATTTEEKKQIKKEVIDTQKDARSARKQVNEDANQEGEGGLRTYRSRNSPPMIIDNSKFFEKVQNSREKRSGLVDNKRENHESSVRPDIGNLTKPGTKLEGRSEKPSIKDVQSSQSNIKDHEASSGSAKKRGEKRENVTGKESFKNRDSSRSGDHSSRRQGKKEKLSEEQKAERATKAVLTAGIGYEFGSAEIGEAQAKRFLEINNEKLLLAKQSGEKVTIFSSASRPGEEDENKKLSMLRGENLKQLLMDVYGFSEDQIVAVALGEVHEGLELPGSDNQDNAFHRVARIDIAEKMTREDPEDKPVEVKESEINYMITMGKVISDKLGGTIVKSIKEAHQMLENPVIAPPSKDVTELGGQVIKLSKDVGKSLIEAGPFAMAKMAGKYSLGAFFDLFSSNLSGDVAANRNKLYNPFIEGVVSGLFPGDHIPTNTWDTPEQKSIFDHAQRATQNLSNEEQLQMKLYFIYMDRKWLDSPGAGKMNQEYVNQHMDSQTIRSGANKLFSSSEYRYR